MLRLLALLSLTILVFSAPAYAGGITGQYVEARTCDVWTGPCFANAEMNWGGKNAVLAWKIEKGSMDNVSLDGLGVVAVIAATDTLGLEQTGSGKAVIIVDERATEAQKSALVNLAKKQSGRLTDKVIKVEIAKVDLELCDCQDGGCAKLDAGKAHIETRCIGHHDKVCGNEKAFYPPLSKGVEAKAAVAVKHGFEGEAFGTTWQEKERRGAYVGTFSVR